MEVSYILIAKAKGFTTHWIKKTTAIEQQSSSRHMFLLSTGVADVSC